MERRSETTTSDESSSSEAMRHADYAKAGRAAERPWTPGPWHANVPQDERYADGSTIREAHHGDIIATVARPLLAKGAVIANARLIAAAPDLAVMVERLLLVVEAYDKQVVSSYGVDVPSDVRDARALLARVLA